MNSTIRKMNEGGEQQQEKNQPENNVVEGGLRN